MNEQALYHFNVLHLYCRTLRVPFNLTLEAFSAWLPATCAHCHKKFCPSRKARVRRLHDHLPVEIGNIEVVCSVCELADSLELRPKKQPKPRTGKWRPGGMGKPPRGICQVCGRPCSASPCGEACSKRLAARVPNFHSRRAALLAACAARRKSIQ